MAKKNTKATQPVQEELIVDTNRLVEIKIIEGYFDRQYQRDMRVGDILEVKVERAQQIIDAGYAVML